MRKSILLPFFVLIFLMGTFAIVNISNVSGREITDLTSAMSLPTTRQIFPYGSIASPVMSFDPAGAKPIGVGAAAKGGRFFGLYISLAECMAPVDIYFGFYAITRDPDHLFFLNQKGDFQAVSIQTVFDDLVPWKQNESGPVVEELFNNIPMSLIPPGDYLFFLLVSPPGDIESYYLWMTEFNVPVPGDGDAGQSEPGRNNRPTLDRLDATRITLSFGREEGKRFDGVASRPGFAGLLFNNQAGTNQVTERLGREITLDSDNDGKPDALTDPEQPDNPIVAAAAGIPSCCTLLVAEGAADPDGDPIVYEWDFPTSGTFYSTGLEGSGGIPAGGLITSSALNNYNRNSIIWEPDDIGYPVLDEALMGGVTRINVRVMDTPANGSSLSSGWQDVALDYHGAIRTEVRVLTCKPIPQNDPDFPPEYWGGMEVIYFAEIFNNFESVVDTTFRVDCRNDIGLDSTIFDVSGAATGGILLNDNWRGCPYAERLEMPGYELSRVNVVASSLGPAVATNPFVYEIGGIPFIMDIFDTKGCAIGDTEVNEPCPENFPCGFTLEITVEPPDPEPGKDVDIEVCTVPPQEGVDLLLTVEGGSSSLDKATTDSSGCADFIIPDVKEDEEYRVRAEALNCDPEVFDTASFRVMEANKAPVADDQSVTTEEGKSVGVTLTGTDPDGDSLTYTVVSQPGNGSLSGTAPNLTYEPEANFSGSDSFTFKVNDGKVDSNVATVSITVEPKPEEYVVWYTENVTCWSAPHIYVTNRDGFDRTQHRCNFSGGGLCGNPNGDEEVVKVEMQGGFSTSSDARKWICSQFTSRHYSYWCGGGSPGHLIIDGLPHYMPGNTWCDWSKIPDVPNPDPGK